jgi:LysM repeat protein
MENRILLTILVTLFSITCSFSAKQEKYVKHTVVKGETINIIAQKYRVTPYDIYRLNPDSQNGIQLNSILLIPPSTSSSNVSLPNSKAQNEIEIVHEVKPKETLFSISKHYDVSIESIQNENQALLKDGLKSGQKIKIPSLKNSNNSPSLNLSTYKEATVYHEIQPRETKYAIAKKYDITIEQLEKQNPEIVSNFLIGFKLLISGNPLPKETVKTEKSDGEIKKEENTGKRYLQEYIVKPKETLYSISSQFDISVKELLSLNPELKEGVKVGMILRVPNVSKVVVTPKVDGDLTKTLYTKTKKELVLLLPFNFTKMETDTLNSTQARLKKDKFLNMTLDFYSGALMAIDSAKVLGMNINVKILDSQETKNSSAIFELIAENNLGEVDAIIGPFYQSNAEKLAEYLEKNNTPVISPLSKEVGKKYSNLFQSMPSNDILKTAMFDYMKAKNGNILAIIDPKKGSVTQYIQNNHKDVKIIGLTEKGGVVSDSLKILLVKDRVNYIILASESTGMILTSTNVMIAALNDYQIQLVILEPNETLEFEEISLTRLTKLKMIYPSLTRPNETLESTYFDSDYKNQNKVIPSQYAIRGFDVTFDTLLRLSQEKTFDETIQTVATQQIENKFDYVQKPSQGYENKGVYILYYDTDLTIKEAQ